MNEYLDYTVNRLTLDDMSILGILFDNEADASFKSMKKTDVFKKSFLTEAMFRKVVYRLSAIGFIEMVTGTKEHSMYISQYGIYALNKSLERVV